MRRSLAGKEAVHGPSHTSTLKTASDLAILLRQMGHFDEATPLCHRALTGCEEALGPSHPQTLIAVANVGCLHRDQGDFAQAEPHLRRAADGLLALLGQQHQFTACAVVALALMLAQDGRAAEAIALCTFGSPGPQLAHTRVDGRALTTLLRDGGQLAEAEELERALGHGTHLCGAP
jgi:hypothetical protein